MIRKDLKQAAHMLFGAICAIVAMFASGDPWWGVWILVIWANFNALLMVSGLFGPQE